MSLHIASIQGSEAAMRDYARSQFGFGDTR